MTPDAERRFEAPVAVPDDPLNWPRSEGATLLLAVAMFALIFSLRLADNDPRAAISMLYVFPISMLALRLGLRAGALAACAAFGLVVAWDLLQEADLRVIHYVVRGSVFLTLGMALGEASRRLRIARVEQIDVMESAPDAIVTVGAEGRIVQINRQAEVLFGWSRAELLGQAVEVLVPEPVRGDHVARREAYQTEFRTRPMGAGLDLTGRRRDGTEFPVEISLSPMRTESGTQVISVIRDITERKRAERSLRESEQRFREFVEGTDDVVIRVDPDGRTIYGNAASERVFGLAPEEMVGRSVFEFVDAGDRDRVRETFTGWLEQRVQSANVECLMVSASGKATDVLWAVNPRYDEDGSPTSVTSIGRDMTRRNRIEQAERERLAVQLQLDSERAEATLRREMLHRAIAAQEDERRRVARELHDETGQALTGVILGLRRIASADGVETARREAERLRELVVGALQELRGLATRLRPTALDDLGLVPALERLAEESSTANVALAVEGLDGRLDPTVETVIYRVVQEALTNVARYAAASRATVRLTCRNGRVTASVTDDGQGFDPEAVERGLGLAGMRERAGLVGGELMISSKPGEGTTISLTIPTDQP